MAQYIFINSLHLIIHNAPGISFIISLQVLESKEMELQQLDNCICRRVFHKLLHAGATMRFTYGRKNQGFVVLAPQAQKEDSWENFYTMQ